MEKATYTISECAKIIGVETHVLRHWQEEVGFQIRRDEYGRRIYTKADVEQIQLIKELKNQGVRLKMIRNMMDENDDMCGKHTITNKGANYKNINQIEYNNEASKAGLMENLGTTIANPTMDDKMRRLQYLLKNMIHETVKQENKEFCEDVKNTLLKEFNYQFERIEEREKQRQEMDEKHYREIDLLLRDFQNGRNRKQEEKPIVHFSMLKKGKLV